jgi:hypothetical protein
VLTFQSNWESLSEKVSEENAETIDYTIIGKNSWEYFWVTIPSGFGCTDEFGRRS